jgi:hypothetical protein
MTVLHQYKISFFKKEILNRIFYGMKSINPLLDQLITDDQTVDDVDESLEAINALLNGDINEINYSGQSLNTIVASPLITLIYDDPEYDANSSHFSLPTSEFKIITEAWRDYLIKNQ